MLSELQLEGFKCFDRLHLDLRSLTLLTGSNGGGKSTVIQALALLAETVGTREWSQVLPLHGSGFSLGSAADVLSQTSSRKEMAFGLRAEREFVRWTFRASDRRSLALKLVAFEYNGVSASIDPPVRWLMPAKIAEQSTVASALSRVSWIGAERTGPRELMPLEEPTARPQVGARGEGAAGILYWREGDLVSEALCVVNHPPTLFHQLRARMQQFFPGCDLRVNPIDGASAVSLSLRSSPLSEFQRPQNVGFGLTQLFPILVALLSATPGDCLLVENPEVHLHPRAQQHVGWLLAAAAASGVQVVVETHSDHVLNGVRLAVKKGQLQASQAAVHFFSLDADRGRSQVTSPSLDADGRLSSWPEGFFDQFDVALSELLES